MGKEKIKITDWDASFWKEIKIPPVEFTQLDWNQTLMTKLNQLNHNNEIVELIVSENLKPLIETLEFRNTYKIIFSNKLLNEEPKPLEFNNVGIIKNGDEILKVINL